MMFFFFFKQKTAYEMRISDWSSDVCSSDLREPEIVDQKQIDNGVENGHGCDQDQRPRHQMRKPATEIAQEVSRIPAQRSRHRNSDGPGQIGRASCRERVCQYV